MNQTRYSLTIIVVLFIIGLGFGYFFLWPSYTQWQQLKVSLSNVTYQLDQLNKKKNLITELEASQPNLDNHNQEAQIFMPIDEQRDVFVSELDSLAQSNGLRLDNLAFAAQIEAKKTDEDVSAGTAARPSPKVADKNVGKDGSKALPFNGTTTGSYHSLKNFLDQIEWTKRYITIGSYQFASAAVTGTEGVDPANPQLSLTFGGAIYTKPKPTLSNILNFSPSTWQFLIDRANKTARVTATPTTSGRDNPFGKY